MTDHKRSIESPAIDISNPEVQRLLNETKDQLTGHERRVFMARVVQILGRGGQFKAEGELGWDRKTIIKGTKEITSNISCVDNFSGRGRKRSEEHLPNLLEDIKQIRNFSKSYGSIKKIWTKQTEFDMHIMHETSNSDNFNSGRAKNAACGAVARLHRASRQHHPATGRTNPTTEGRNSPHKETTAQTQDKAKPPWEKGKKGIQISQGQKTGVRETAQDL
jgi:hypothetical protein